MSTPLKVQTLADAYTTPASQEKRYKELQALLPKGSFHVFARSPGRVNVISEHTDYNGYQVTPIALQQDFVFAVGAQKGKSVVKIYHKLGDKGGCPPDEFDYTLPVEKIAKPNDQWSQYVRAGFHAALFQAKSLGQDLVKSFAGREIHLVGTGCVPLGSGLSSSSALTCCSALAFMAFLKEEKKDFKPQLAAQVAHSESTVAIEGGGMDQAISLNGELGKISVINFNPIAIKNYSMPPTVKIAVFSSLKDSKKATGACNFYNTRVAECRAGCALLIKQKVGDYQKYFADHLKSGEPMALGLPVQKLYEQADPINMLPFAELLPEEITLGELSKQLGFKDFKVFVRQFLRTKVEGNALLGKYDDVKPDRTIIVRKRLMHVYSEAYRAQEFERILKANQPLFAKKHPLAAADQTKYDAVIDKLKTLVNQSQGSCDQDYACSCDELNEVCAKAIECGAFGARLTGAGMGGYAVALVEESKEKDFITKFHKYYISKGQKKEILDDICFITGCGNGGCYIKL